MTLPEGASPVSPERVPLTYRTDPIPGAGPRAAVVRFVTKYAEDPEGVRDD